jgi:hypothetical protein
LEENYLVEELGRFANAGETSQRVGGVARARGPLMIERVRSFFKLEIAAFFRRERAPSSRASGFLIFSRRARRRRWRTLRFIAHLIRPERTFPLPNAFPARFLRADEQTFSNHSSQSIGERTTRGAVCGLRKASGSPPGRRCFANQSSAIHRCFPGPAAFSPNAVDFMRKRNVAENVFNGLRRATPASRTSFSTRLQGASGQRSHHQRKARQRPRLQGQWIIGLFDIADKRATTRESDGGSKPCPGG